MVKSPPANAGDTRNSGSIPGSRRASGGGHGNPLQYSCLENSMDRGAWRAIVHGAAKSQALKWLSTHHVLSTYSVPDTVPFCRHHFIFTTSWTVARQAPLSMEFSRQEYWNGLPFPSPGDLPDPGIKPTSLVSPALAGGFSTSWATGECLTLFFHSPSSDSHVLP